MTDPSIQAYPVRLIPDWELAGPVLLGGCPRRNRPSLASGLYETLKDHLRSNGREVFLAVAVAGAGLRKSGLMSAPSLRDIWLRDFCGLPARDATGRACVCTFRYRPRYLSAAEARDGDAAGRELAHAFGLPVHDVPLVLDGGNITHNGAGTAITTARILVDNAPVTEVEVREILGRHCGIERLIIIPEEPGDVTGHIDGMVRFLGQKTVAVGLYPESYGEGWRFMEAVSKKLREQLGPDHQIVRIPNDEPEDAWAEGIASAAGNRVNFLRVGDLCLVPAGGAPGDELAADVLRSAVPGLGVALVYGCAALARAGGLLNCMSWGIP